MEILTLIAEGLPQKQIGNQLHISTHTVIDHVRHIYDKLNVQNAPAAVAKAFRTGLFSTTNED
jgi:DNA-binding CsgD family transcriptional regulator